MTEPPQFPTAPPLLHAPERSGTVKAPLVVCLIGAAMSWALVAGCYRLIAVNTNTNATEINPDAYGLVFGTLGLYR